MHARPAPSWFAFDDWCRPRQPTPDWEGVDALLHRSLAATSTLSQRLTVTLTDSDIRLHNQGGDPARTTWQRFRPLRLSREEDWSDWLCWLLEMSDTGEFAKHLLTQPGPPAALARPAGQRELTTRMRHLDGSTKEFRADILLEWSDETHTHIEVKLRDQNRTKIFSTAQSLEQVYPNTHHFILLHPNDTPAWEAETTSARATSASISTITWVDVTKALRRSVTFEPDPLWRSFAVAFWGAIEQKILQLPQVTKTDPRAWLASDLGRLNMLLEIRQDQEMSNGT